MNTTKKYFLYARKSSEGEDRQITSIEDQISECKKLADSLNIEIIDVISEAKSAKAPGRKKFSEMIERIQRGEAQGILCWKLNRLARNPIDGGNIIWLLQNGIIGHIQTFGRDYKPMDNVIVMYVELGMSNQYVIDLSVDVKRGCREKAHRGWYPATILPLGYKHNPERFSNRETKEITTDSITFSTVKKLWKLLLTGLYTMADIKREGDAMGLTSRSGKFYSLSNYHSLFSNEFYSGYFYWKDERGQRIRYLGKHKPMISEQEFLEAQRILGKNKKSTRLKQHSFPYRGLLTCGECAGFVTAEHKLQVICTECKYKFSIKIKDYCPKCLTKVDNMKNPSKVDKVYYHCTKKKHKSCSQKSVTGTCIDSYIMSHLKNININEDFYNFAIEALERLNKEDSHKDDKIIIQLKKRRTELKSRVEQLICMRADGEIDAQQLHSTKEANSEAIKQLEQKIRSLDHGRINWLKLAKENLHFALTCINSFEKGDDRVKNLLVSKLGSNLILKDKSLYFIKLKPL